MALSTIDHAFAPLNHPPTFRIDLWCEGFCIRAMTTQHAFRAMACGNGSIDSTPRIPAPGALGHWPYCPATYPMPFHGSPAYVPNRIRLQPTSARFRARERAHRPTILPDRPPVASRIQRHGGESNTQQSPPNPIADRPPQTPPVAGRPISPSFRRARSHARNPAKAITASPPNPLRHQSSQREYEPIRSWHPIKT